MDYSKISLVEVKAIAKERGIKVTGLKKQEIIDVLMQNDAGKQQEEKKAAKADDKAADKPAKKDSEKAADKPRELPGALAVRIRRCPCCGPGLSSGPGTSIC